MKNQQIAQKLPAVTVKMQTHLSLIFQWRFNRS